ncbi:MAG: class I SAM-dependent methyltransferase [Victivallaceae bacterium]
MDDKFWQIRAAKYDKLFWTKDESYIDLIIKMGDLEKSDLVLDVGTGTGVVGRAIQPFVNHVIGLDNSAAMLEKGDWEGISIVKWDIADRIFKDALFNKIFARMVFHHILENLDKTFIRCYDLLKDGGKLVVAEGVPPSDDPEIIQWYADMFALKEERRVFTKAELEHRFLKNGFKNISTCIHEMNSFNVHNWIMNSGLSKENSDKIIDMHYNAPSKVKDAYNMRITDDTCFIDTQNVIVVGEK